MIVTAKLSKELYNRLGERVANELVVWFNSVSEMYRSDLREFNEMNFSRFDATLEQRLAQFEAKLERRLAQSDAKLERLAQATAQLEQRLTSLDVDRRFAALDVKIERVFADHLKWSFVFWLGTIGAIIASATLKP